METMLKQDASNASGVNMEKQGVAVEDDLQTEIDAVYTPFEEAKEEIWRRWNDKALKKRVEEFLGGDIPEVFKNSPRAVFSRQLPSPNFETFRFSELVEKVGIQPVLFEYPLDKFTTKNPDKYFLGKVFFYEGVGKNGGRKLSSFKVFDIDKFDGKPFSNISTFRGQNLVNFYHNLMKNTFSSLEIFDITPFYKRSGGVSGKYYMRYLSFFVCFGILFENYPLSGSYFDFTKKVFLPNFLEASKIFGSKPLIVRLVPKERECDMYWRYCPSEIMREFMLQ